MLTVGLFVVRWFLDVQRPIVTDIQKRNLWKNNYYVHFQVLLDPNRSYRQLRIKK